MATKHLSTSIWYGVFGHLVVVGLMVSLDHFFQVNLMKIWIGPAPAVSFLASFIASLCFLYRLDERKFIRADYRKIAVTMLIFSICSLFLIYFLQYSLAQEDSGQKITEIVSFREYLTASFSASSMKLGHQSANEAIQLGKAGFLLPTMECLAYMIGGSWVGFSAWRASD